MAKITNKPVFFTSGEVKIEDGKLIWKTGFLFKVIDLVHLENIVAIRPEKGILNPRVSIFYLATEKLLLLTKVIKMKQDQIPLLLEALKATGKVPFFKDEKYVFTHNGKPSLQSVFDCKGDLVNKKDSKVLLYKDYCVPMDEYYCHKYEDIRFFNNSGSSVNFGFVHTATLKNVNAHNRDILKNELIKRGAKIELKTGKEFTGSLMLFKWLNPMNWFRKETLIITDDAFIFDIKKRRKAETIYLLHSEASTISVNGGKLKILGRQNINSSLKFSREARKAATSIILKDQAEYNNYEAACWFKLLGLIKLWRCKDKGHIHYSDKGLLIYPSKEHRKQPNMPEFYKVQLNDIRSIGVKSSFLNQNKLFIYMDTGNVRYNHGINGNQFSDVEMLGFNRITGAKKLQQFVTSKSSCDVMKKKEVKKLIKLHGFAK
ncbi:MAG: hypothetical protein NC217_02360 [Muribaculaceae bacterium]|nr:hypothetical protein [Lachnospiraceae bacterium]MCM1319207.1 hypothetical protein [Muribaculaceae bacterium]